MGGRGKKKPYRVEKRIEMDSGTNFSLREYKMPKICLEKWNRERDISIYINKIGLEIDL